jgi:hypothetical protein
MSSTQQVIIEKFLSKLQDQYNKNTYWRNNVKSLWIDAFKKVPAVKLQQLLDRYFQREMGAFLPALSHVIDFVKADVGERYFIVERGIYCHHCRDDANGTTGGFRKLEMRYYDPKAKDGRGDHVVFNGVARCDCEASKGSGGNFKDVFRKICKIDPHAICRVSSQDDIMAIDTEEMWSMRIKRGYVRLCRDDVGEYFEPIWEHRFWTSGLGFAVAHQLDWEMPESVKAVALRKQRKRRTSLNLDRMKQSDAMNAVVDLINTKTLEQQ